ncbi:MAG: polysaccharide deacetylase family protein [Candidatus Kapabacteria bacterium]|nr:polysaccharide deacetylase family protein [Candidatus Kapabacteria bacterium]
MIADNNIFTVDLEDRIYTVDYHTDLKASTINQIKSTLINNTNEILRILRSSDCTATFFVLGKLADDLPALIKKIQDDGHEIACHGYDHKSLKLMNPNSFRIDLERASNAIYGACGTVPRGFRAPYFSISDSNLWTVDILKEMDFDYDSSVQPFGYHPDYGYSNSSANIYNFKNGLTEIPLSVSEFSKLRIPCSGGAYFRFYPYKLFSHLFRTSFKQNNHSIFYIHPWELSKSDYLEPDSRLSTFRKYYNTENTISKLEKFAVEFQFVSISQFLNKITEKYVN